MRVVTVAQVELLLVIVSRRRAIDHHRGPVDGFERIVLGFHAHGAKLRHLLPVDGQSRAFVLEREHFRFIGQQRRALVESHLVNA
jgi:hypothetical protein